MPKALVKAYIIQIRLLLKMVLRKQKRQYLTYYYRRTPKPKNASILHTSILFSLITFLLLLSYYYSFIKEGISVIGTIQTIRTQRKQQEEGLIKRKEYISSSLIDLKLLYKGYISQGILYIELLNISQVLELA